MSFPSWWGVFVCCFVCFIIGYWLGFGAAYRQAAEMMNLLRMETEMYMSLLAPKGEPEPPE